MFKTVLVAVDLSEMSGDVLHYAARLAGASPGARLVVANIVLDPLRQPYTVEAVGVDWVRLQRNFMADAEGRLAALIEGEGLRPGTFTPVVVMAAQAADAIVELARSRGADVIVIGTHGYGPIKHFVLGSVAERVLRRAGCPVVTVPHKSLSKLKEEADADVFAIS